MSPLVEITAVGALVRPAGDDRHRPKVRFDRVNVSDDDARRLVEQGVAALVNPTIAEGAEIEEPQAGAIDLDRMSIPELRRFANDRRIRLSGARTKPEIIASIDAAMAEALAEAQTVPDELDVGDPPETGDEGGENGG